MASAVDSRLAYARLAAVATASRLPTATRDSNNSYTTSWDTTSLEHIRKVNPNSHTTPVYRWRRDPELSVAIYSRLPVLVDRSSGEEVKAWPVKYLRMFDMANDSQLFCTRSELEEQEGAYHIGGNRFSGPAGEWVPLYEGKMVQAFDHRAASIVIAEKNLYRRGQGHATDISEHEGCGSGVANVSY